MKHLNEDTLLKLALDLLEGEEKAQALSHLTECGNCREAFAKLKSEAGRLGDFEPELPEARYPLPRTKSAGKLWLLRAAALLLIGFAGGVGVSNYFQEDCVNVFPYSAQMRNPVMAEDGLVICESEALEVTIR